MGFGFSGPSYVLNTDIGRANKYSINFKNQSSWVQFHQRSTSSFYACRSQKRKKLLNLTVFFVLLGSMSTKAAHRTLVKLTPGVKPCNELEDELPYLLAELVMWGNPNAKWQYSKIMLIIRQQLFNH